MTRRRRGRRSFARTLALGIRSRLVFAAFMFAVVLPLVLVWAQGFKLRLSTPSQAPAAAAVTYTLTGTLELAQRRDGPQTNFSVPTDPPLDCEGLGAYADLRARSHLTVEDENGTVIGQGELGTGQIDLNFDRSKVACHFPFIVPGLPRAARYQIDTGNPGSFSYAFDDLVSKRWYVTVSVGP
jgi:hypothetical protein